MSVPSLFQRASSLDPFGLLDSPEYELDEEDGVFVLSVELPGFDRDEMTVAWDEGILTIAAEYDDERRVESERYQRRFRFPKEIDEDAEYDVHVVRYFSPTAIQEIETESGYPSGRDRELRRSTEERVNAAGDVRNAEGGLSTSSHTVTD